MGVLKQERAIGIETCPHCAGALSVIVCIKRPAMIVRI